MKRRASGLATVEFAIVGAVAFTVLLSCIEVARMLYIWNSLGEATRRAARIAAVCPVNDAAIVRAAMLNFTGEDADSSEYLHGLTPANVGVSYLDADGAGTAVFSDIAFVRVSITGYTHNLLIPFVSPSIDVPTFSTTIPTESLGLIPETGARTCLNG